MKALIALLVVALLVAGCVTPQQYEANASQPQDGGGAVSQAPDTPPPFPDEENGGTTDTDGPPPLPE